MELTIALGLLRSLRELHQREHWSRAVLEAHQASALRRLRTHAYNQSPFYREFHHGLLDRPLAELPVLTKAILMARFDDLVTDRAVRLADVRTHLAGGNAERRFHGRYWVNATSGSSGQPGIFLFDHAEWITVLGSFARAHAWAGGQVRLTHPQRMAVVASTDPFHLSAQMGAAVRSGWMPTLRLASPTPLPQIVTALNRWQPRILVTYASMARILADEQLAGRLLIAPDRVFTSSDVLTEEARRHVAAAWGHQPFDQYAVTEAGGVAAECTVHAGLHLFEDLVISEVVDKQDRPVPPGTYGARLLITVLGSRTLPLIRYAVDDTICLAPGPCACGRAFIRISGIQGRSEDILYLPAAAGSGAVAVQPNVFKHILDTLPVTGWRVVQEPRGGLHIVLGGLSGDLATLGLEARLTTSLAAIGAHAPALTFELVDTIPVSAGGKRPLIVAHRAPA